MNWHEILGLSVHPAELIVRGSLIYWLLFLIFRFLLRRDVGAVGIADVLLLVLIADAAQNAMAGGYTSVTDGALLVGTIVGWNWLLDWGSFHSRHVRALVTPAAVTLVRNGQLLRRNLRAPFDRRNPEQAARAGDRQARRREDRQDGARWRSQRDPPSGRRCRWCESPAGAVKSDGADLDDRRRGC
jgi:hypothetical protein